MKAILFDLDGTLLDTTEGVVESVVYAAQKMGYGELPFSTLLKFVGPPIQTSFEIYYGSSKEEAQNAAGIFRDYYKEEALFKAKPYKGIYTLMEQLVSWGYKLGVATYKREDYAITLLKKFGFDKYCISMHGADQYNMLTKADIVNVCITELNVPKKDIVLVGDTEHDEKGAKLAGVSFLGVTYGFGFQNSQNLEKYNSIGWADSAMDIGKILTMYA